MPVDLCPVESRRLGEGVRGTARIQMPLKRIEDGSDHVGGIDQTDSSSGNLPRSHEPGIEAQAHGGAPNRHAIAPNAPLSRPH